MADSPSNVTSAVFVGIDVSKATLDVHIIPQGCSFSLPNDPGGCTKLIERLTPLNVSMVVVEATGRYQRRVAADLISARIPVAVVNPRQARTLPKAWASSPRLTASTLKFWHASHRSAICERAKNRRKMPRSWMTVLPDDAK